MCYKNYHKERHKNPQLIQPVHLIPFPKPQYILFQSYNLISQLIYYSKLFTARAFLFCNHKHTLQITEKKKRILNAKVSKTQNPKPKTKNQNQNQNQNSPKRNTQPPNSLRLNTNRLRSPNPRNIINLPTNTSNITRKPRCKRICGGILIAQLRQRRTLQVRKWLADDDGDDNQCD